MPVIEEGMGIGVLGVGVESDGIVIGAGVGVEPRAGAVTVGAAGFVVGFRSGFPHVKQ